MLDISERIPHELKTDVVSNELPSWSSDGKWIYLSSSASGRHKIYRVPSTGGSATPIAGEGSAVSRETKDGKSLYFTVEPHNELRRKVLPNGPEAAAIPEIHVDIAATG